MRFLLRLDGPRARDVPVHSPHFVVGRSEECDLTLDSPLISRRHCELTVDDSRLFIRDLGSCNGTGINNTPLVGERLLRDGDVIWVAATPMEVRIRSAKSTSAELVEVQGKSSSTHDTHHAAGT